MSKPWWMGGHGHRHGVSVTQVEHVCEADHADYKHVEGGITAGGHISWWVKEYDSYRTEHAARFVSLPNSRCLFCDMKLPGTLQEAGMVYEVGLTEAGVVGGVH